MPVFTITGTNDPFLHVSLNKGDSIYAEKGAMVTMEDTLDLHGRAQGGILSGLARTFFSGESFFQQCISATRGSGDVLLAPTLPGDVQILQLGASQYRLNDGAFLAAESTVSLGTRTQGIGQGLFGGTGGFFIMETSGTGQLAINGFGTLFEIDVRPGVDAVVDNSHVIAWDATLQYRISTATAQQGFFRNLVNSATSGEGLVNRFTGSGKVIVCSRNQGGFVSWLQTLLGASRR